MIRLLIFGLMAGWVTRTVLAQTNPYPNRYLMTYLNNNKNFKEQRALIARHFKNVAPGPWGEFIHGVDADIVTNRKLVAFTFDACGGSRRADGYNVKLIQYLKEQKVPATLFLTGMWIDANYRTFKMLASDTLFEIENHGLYHRPCSVNGNSKYGIKGTANIWQAFDEIDANAEKIRLLTGRRPVFYRSATAYIDEASVKMARMIGTTVISYDVLSGDAVPHTPTAVIVKNVLRNVRPGALIIMHLNHPENNDFEAIRMIIPELRKRGYAFVKLQGYKLEGKKMGYKVKRKNIRRS